MRNYKRLFLLVGALNFGAAVFLCTTKQWELFEPYFGFSMYSFYCARLNHVWIKRDGKYKCVLETPEGRCVVTELIEHGFRMSGKKVPGGYIQTNPKPLVFASREVAVEALLTSHSLKIVEYN